MAEIILTSDNAGPAHPDLITAAAAAAGEAHPAYGADVRTAEAEEAVRRTFACDARLYLVPTGTAANVLALAGACPVWGAVFCHQEAHIRMDEGTAPGFFTGGARIEPLPGAHAKVTPGAFDAVLTAFGDGPHASKPAVLSLTNLTERGAAYGPDEIRALSDRARAADMRVHMDGARFANAAAATGAHPADLTWRSGVDLLSLGATKNGALFCEALIVFRDDLAADFERLRKRGAHLMSKAAVPAAQLCAWLKNGLWLELATRANDAARACADRLHEAGLSLADPCDGNEVFLALTEAEAATARASGLVFYDWPGGLARLVFDWTKTREEGVEAAERLLAAKGSAR